MSCINIHEFVVVSTVDCVDKFYFPCNQVDKSRLMIVDKMVRKCA